MTDRPGRTPSAFPEWDCRFCGTSFDGCEQSPYPCCTDCDDTPHGGHLTEDGKAPGVIAPARTPSTPLTVNDCESPGMCWICGNKDDHNGLTHADAMGDGLTRYAILEYLADVRS